MIGRGSKKENAAAAWSIASALLRYPDETLIDALPQIRAAVIESRIDKTAEVVELIDGWLGRNVIDLQQEYVAVFDMGRNASLHMTWHQYGDRRQRGLVLLKLKREFQEYGMSPVEDELPDWLPLMLEFAVRAPEPAGRELLEKWRAPIELVRGSLHDQDRPQAVLLDLVSGTLSKLGPSVRDAVETLLAEGPPGEDVGLEPFGPDNDMPSAMMPVAHSYAPTGGQTDQ